MSTTDLRPGPTSTQRPRFQGWPVRALRIFVALAAVYLLLLAVHALLGRWTPEFLQGRDLWHFLFPRMIVPMVMLGVFFSVARLIPAGVMLASAFLFVGTLSAIKRESTGEPFQVSDLFLAGQSMHLLHYVHWYHGLLGLSVIPAAFYFIRNLRVRWWSLPLALLCVGLLSTYRIERVANWIHDNSWWIGVENLTFSQSDSERMNGLGTHLYFSTAGLRLKTYAEAEVAEALAALRVAPVTPAAAALAPVPDIYLVLGEAWWRDPDDRASPLDALKQAGFVETEAVSPVYGGTTPNAEFEVLTGIPIRSFRDGIIPYQHYVQYISDASRTLPRLLAARGYATTAYHNFTPRFWLRDQIYPKLGFGRFLSMDDMTLTIQPNDWPTDDGLYRAVRDASSGDAPRFHFIVTVETHGPYEKQAADPEGHNGVADYRTRFSSALAALVDFKKELDASGRPYVLVAFGDHLPGLRLHQWKNGMKTETDPRLHQVPVLVASNTRDAAAFAHEFTDRPLYCMAPLLMDWAGQSASDRYLQYLGQSCRAMPGPVPMPAEPVIQNQLFAAAPL